MQLAAMLAAVFLFSFAAHALERPLSEEADAGRILRLDKKIGRYEPGTFLVFESMQGDGLYKCRVLNGTARVTALGSSLSYEIDCFEGIEPYAFSFFVLPVFPSGREGARLELLEALGHTLRGELMRKMTIFEHDILKSAKSLKNGEISQDEFYAGLFNGVPSDLIAAAMADNDLMLAIALVGRFENFYGVHSANFFRNDKDMRASGYKEIAETKQKLVDEFANMTKALPARFEDFRNACPGVRGLWSAAAPRDYRTLLAFWNSACVSYAKAWNLSSTVYFERWGAAVLDAMLFVNGSPEAADMEKDFDAALEKYKKIHTEQKDENI